MSQSTAHSIGRRVERGHVSQQQSEPSPVREHGERMDGWLRDSAISGFFATFAFSVVLAAAYGAAYAIGEESGNQIQRWAWNLVHNPLVQSTEDRITLAIALNLTAGIFFALIYGRLFEPVVHFGSVKEGMLFSLIPFLLSITVFFPIMDGGFLGADIDAGPLPVLGNLMVHLVYGAVLGWIYGIPLESGIDDTPLDRAANEGAERGAALGVPMGALIGAVIAFAIQPTVDDITNTLLTVVIGVVSGGAVGLLIGSLMGMGNLGDEEEWSDA
jgi:hypothetical protein